jgi:hypothetical protein
MEIKVLEKFEEFNDNSNLVCEELKNLILGKEIKLYEYDEESKIYDYVNDYKIENIFMWEEDQIAFSFGPDEYDVCSINKTDLIKIE